MEKHIVYNGISYTLHGDSYFPDLNTTPPTTELDAGAGCAWST